MFLEDSASLLATSETGAVKNILTNGWDMLFMLRDSNALILASKNGHYDVAKLLLEKGAKVDLLDRTDGGSGSSALMLACQNGHYAVAKLLLEKGAQVDLQSDTGTTALMSACSNEHFEVATLLLQHGAQRDLMDVFGQSVVAVSEEELQNYYEVSW